MPPLAALAALSLFVGIATADSYTLDSSRPGPRFDGYGAISGGGATSRLLFTYPPEVVSEIADYLFLPQFGASLHHLKVEIGGDGQSSEGVEPSHQHTETDLNCTRGYEWQLMKEARARNPKILLSALAWTWPGWLGYGVKGAPWQNDTRTAGYLISWLQCARSAHLIELDYINADMNEASEERGEWGGWWRSGGFLCARRERVVVPYPPSQPPPTLSAAFRPLLSRHCARRWMRQASPMCRSCAATLPTPLSAPTQPPRTLSCARSSQPWGATAPWQASPKRRFRCGIRRYV